jgi:NAD(P)H-dependent FMN reductase
MRLVGVSGSLRAGSYNSALLRAAQKLAPDGVELIEGSIRGIPSMTATSSAIRACPRRWSC